MSTATNFLLSSRSWCRASRVGGGFWGATKSHLAQSDATSACTVICSSNARARASCRSAAAGCCANLDIPITSGAISVRPHTQHRSTDRGATADARNHFLYIKWSGWDSAEKSIQLVLEHTCIISYEPFEEIYLRGLKHEHEFTI